jgi:hypothetical protein
LSYSQAFLPTGANILKTTTRQHTALDECLAAYKHICVQQIEYVNREAKKIRSSISVLFFSRIPPPTC